MDNDDTILTKAGIATTDDKDEGLDKDVDAGESDADSHVEDTDSGTDDNAEDTNGDKSEGDLAEEPFRHEFKYRANEKDEVEYLEYDADGNLTPETLSKLASTYSKTVGLERRTQLAVEESKRLARERDAERVRAEALKQQIERLRKEYDDPIQKIKQNRAAAVLLERSGIRFPDTNALNERLELEELRAERQRAEATRVREDFLNAFVTHLSDLSDEQRDAVATEVAESGMLESLRGASDLQAAKRQFLSFIDKTVSDMRIKGRLPNPAMDKILAEKEKASQALKRSRDRKPARNPLTGAGKTSAGKATPKWTWRDVHAGRITQSEYIQWVLKNKGK